MASSLLGYSVMTDADSEAPVRPSPPPSSRVPVPFPPQPVRAGQRPPTSAPSPSRFSYPPPTPPLYVQTSLPDTASAARGPPQLPTALEEERANVRWIRDHLSPLPPPGSVPAPGSVPNGSMPLSAPPSCSSFTPVPPLATIPAGFVPSTSPSTAARALPGAFIPQPASSVVPPSTAQMAYLPAMPPRALAPSWGTSYPTTQAPYPAAGQAFLPGMGPPPTVAPGPTPTWQNPPSIGTDSGANSTSSAFAGPGSQYSSTTGQPNVDSSNFAVPSSAVSSLPGRFEQQQRRPSGPQGRGDPYAPTPRSASISACDSAPPPPSANDSSDVADDTASSLGVTRPRRSFPAMGDPLDGGSARGDSIANSAPPNSDDSAADYSDSSDPSNVDPGRAGMPGTTGMGGAGPATSDPPLSSDSDPAFEPRTASASASAAGTGSSDAGPTSRFEPSLSAPSSSSARSRDVDAQDAYPSGADLDSRGSEFGGAAVADDAARFRPQPASSAGAGSSDPDDSDGDAAYPDSSQSAGGQRTCAAPSDRFAPPLASGRVGDEDLPASYVRSSEPAQDSDTDRYDSAAARLPASEYATSGDMGLTRSARGAPAYGDDRDAKTGAADTDGDPATSFGGARAADPVPRQPGLAGSYAQDSDAHTDSSNDDGRTSRRLLCYSCSRAS